LSSFSSDKAITDSVALEAGGSLRLSLTVTNGGKPRRPHQAFLTVANKDGSLEESFPLTINDKGKAKFDLVSSASGIDAWLTVQTPAKIPTALLASNSPLAASIVIGSFGTSKPLKSKVFDFSAPVDSSASTSTRYGAKPEIHHIFRDDPRSPPKVLTLAFTLAVVACLPGLLITWAGIGANLSHLPKALGSAPISHVLFFGSIVGMEFVFFKYYTEWRLFTLLPVAGVVGLVAFLSGSGALTEVQERRLKGER
jgi:oligosaccharyltransferase complex subunit delta (ribophorin II)